MNIKIVAHIETEEGVFYRISDAWAPPYNTTVPPSNLQSLYDGVVDWNNDTYLLDDTKVVDPNANTTDYRYVRRWLEEIGGTFYLYPPGSAPALRREFVGSTVTVEAYNRVGFLSYPDVRCNKIELWFDEGNGYKRAFVGGTKISEKLNIAYVDVDRIALIADGSGKSLEDYDTTGISYESNRVMISETGAPFVFKAGKTYYIGDQANESIHGFGVNQLAVSQGQFGQYPLIAFTNSGVWALEQSSDPLIAFSRVSPISLSHWVSSEKAITNIDRSVAFANKNGIYIISGSDMEEIGEPIYGLLDDPSNLALGYYQDNDVKELWVADTNTIFIYNLKFGRWYQADRKRISFANKDTDLYGLDEAGNVWAENDTKNESVLTKIEFEPIHFGMPDRYKRIYDLFLRARYDSDTVTLAITGGTESDGAYQGDLLSDGGTDVLEILSVDWSTMSAEAKVLEGETVQSDTEYTNAQDVSFELDTFFNMELSFESTSKVFRRSGYRIRPRHRSDHSANVSIVGFMDPVNGYLHRIETEYQPRLPHKVRGTYNG